MTRIRREGTGRSVERFSIARHAVGSPVPTALRFLALVAAWIVLTLVLVPSLGVSAAISAPILVGGLIAMVAALLVYMNLRGRLTVGDDGVWIDDRAQKRFIPYSELEHAETYRENVLGKEVHGVVLALFSDETLRIAVGELADAEATVLAMRVREAIARYREREEGADGSMLARGERDARAWLRDLRAMADDAHARLRAPSVPKERLWTIVEDPKAEAQARAGAAAVLGASLDQEGRERLRVAAKTIAAPKLRVAIESAAQEDEEALVVALEELENKR